MRAKAINPDARVAVENECTAWPPTPSLSGTDGGNMAAFYLQGLKMVQALQGGGCRYGAESCSILQHAVMKPMV